MTALAVGVGALEKQWLAVAVALILGGVAYTTRTHESRFFAAVYTLAAFALFFTHVTELSFAVGSFFAGGVLLSLTGRSGRAANQGQTG